MPKTKISEFSATPGNNTDIDGINISEGCAPSGINDAIRELMAQLKDFQAGTAGDSFNGPIGSTTPAAGTFTNLSASGTFALTGDQVQISEGGTGQTTANAAFNALAPSQSTHAGKYLKTDGTNTSWDAIDINTADITGTLPIANGGTGLTALGTGVQTALGQNVTGSGGIVLASSPTLTTPNLGTPSAVTLTNATGLPLSTGVTGTLATTNGGTGLTSFTANGVVYASSSSALTTGSALTFDGTNLGVGTSSPARPLHVASSATSYLARFQNSGSALALINFKDNTTADFSVGIGANGESLVGHVGNTEQMRLTSTGLGIGTSSPAYKLDVVGGSASVSNSGNNPQYRVVDGSVITKLQSLSVGYTGGWVGTESNNNFQIVTNNSAKATFDTSGNLGIGTSSPTARLTVVTSVNNEGVIRVSDNATYYGELSRVNATDEVRLGSYGPSQNLTFYTVSSERMRLDSSGNLGLGVTPSASWDSIFKAIQIGSASYLSIAAQNTVAARGSILWNAVGSGDESFVYRNTGDPANRFMVGSGFYAWYTAPSGTAGNAISFTQAMTLDASGNLLVGTTSTTPANANGLIAYGGTDAGIVYLQRTTGTDQLRFYVGGNRLGYLNTASSAVTLGTANFPLVFATNDTERARITSGGAFLVGATSAVASELFLVRTTASAYVGRLANDSATAANCFGQFLWYSSAAPNGTGNQFLRCDDSAATRAEIRSNGGLANYQSNNVDLSDARTKKEITPAPSYWDKIGALEIVTYKYNDQTHDDVNVGVIAQQVESVEPVWVDADGFGEAPEDGVPLKTVYTKDITFAAIKALQEAMARIEQLEAKVAALEAK